jgi:hypothetical protein
MVFNAGEETFELDPDEELELELAEHPTLESIANDRALATRALTLGGTEEPTLTIEYVHIKWRGKRLSKTGCRVLSAAS